MNTKLAELQRLHSLQIKYFQTPPSRVNEVFTAEEIAILKQSGTIHKASRKVRTEDAAIYGAAYTTLSGH